jgi:hypothetical protein
MDRDRLLQYQAISEIYSVIKSQVIIIWMQEIKLKTSMNLRISSQPTNHPTNHIILSEINGKLHFPKVISS